MCSKCRKKRECGGQWQWQWGVTDKVGSGSGVYVRCWVHRETAPALFSRALNHTTTLRRDPSDHFSDSPSPSPSCVFLLLTVFQYVLLCTHSLPSSPFFQLALSIYLSLCTYNSKFKWNWEDHMTRPIKIITWILGLYLDSVPHGIYLQ